MVWLLTPEGDRAVAALAAATADVAASQHLRAIAEFFLGFCILAGVGTWAFVSLRLHGGDR